MSPLLILCLDGRRNQAPHTSIVLGKKKGGERKRECDSPYADYRADPSERYSHGY